MNILVILQGPAYGDERAYNGLRLVGNLAKRDDVTDWTLWADKTITF